MWRNIMDRENFISYDEMEFILRDFTVEEFKHSETSLLHVHQLRFYAPSLILVELDSPIR
jgi:hypothetical protein